MQIPDKRQIEDQANTNKSNGIYTHTYRQKKKKKQKTKQPKKKKRRRRNKVEKIGSMSKRKQK